jgi:dipeptidyl aminopeptidase/acylaminoacyl peptidase
MELVSPETVGRLRAAEARLLQGLRRLRSGLGRAPAVQAGSFVSTAGYRVSTLLALPAGPGPHPGVVVCVDRGTDKSALVDGGAPVTLAGLAHRGLAALVFDPAGRGESWGEEDAGGPEHQDNAACAVRQLAAEAAVDGRRVGLLGLGFGSLSAIGAVARHGAPAAWVVDWEGPADRETCLATGGEGPWGPDDTTFWADREPKGTVGQLDCPYVRLQAEDDHAVPGELRHALRMVWAVAAARAEAPGPWFQINDHPPGEALERPVWLPGGALAARRAIYRKLAVLADLRR